EFTILIDSTSSRAIISVDDIETIEFDSPASRPQQQPTKPANQTSPSNSNRTVSDQNPDEEDTDLKNGAKGNVPNIRALTVAIPAREDWTSTGLIVAKGQKIRITASG